MRKDAKTTKTATLSTVGQYHGGNWGSESYAFQGFRSNKYFTSDRSDKEYSDTAHYIAEFLHYLVRSPEDLRDPGVLDAIRRTTNDCRWALMDATGYIAHVGSFIKKDGLLFSNGTFRDPKPAKLSAWAREYYDEDGYHW